MEPSQKIDFLYKEYTRLNVRLDQISDSSLDDFKLLGAVSTFLIGAGSFISKYSDSVANTQFVFLITFIIILLITSIIGFRDLQKLSLIKYYFTCIEGLFSILLTLYLLLLKKLKTDI